MKTVKIIHHVSCSSHSEPAGSADFDRVQAKAIKLEQYARRLGFDVMYESVDEEWS